MESHIDMPENIILEAKDATYICRDDGHLTPEASVIVYRSRDGNSVSLDTPPEQIRQDMVLDPGGRHLVAYVGYNYLERIIFNGNVVWDKQTNHQQPGKQKSAGRGELTLELDGERDLARVVKSIEERSPLRKVIR